MITLKICHKNVNQRWLIFTAGFVSVACCADHNYTDHNTNISWIEDSSWFPDKTGCQKITRAAANYTGYDEARIFNIDFSGKRCYSLDTIKGQDYLIRGTFLYYGDIILKTTFSISVGVTEISQVNSPKELEVEGVFRANKRYIDFCLVKSEGAPYISQLELRPLKGLEYLQGFSSSVLKLVQRVDLGSKEGNIIRYVIYFYQKPRKGKRKKEK